MGDPRRPPPSSGERGASAVDAPRTFVPLAPADDTQAAAILATCTPEGTVDSGRVLLAALHADPHASVYGAFDGDELVALYALRTSGVTAELTLLAVAPPHRRRGHGRACLADALDRAGKRPLVVETDPAALPFYTAAGFKLVGKRRHPSGALRYRLGWHAPRPHSVAKATDPRPLECSPLPRTGRVPSGRGRG